MERGLRAAGWLAALVFIAVGVGELLLADGSLAHRMTFAVVLGVFAALVVVGRRPNRHSAVGWSCDGIGRCDRPEDGRCSGRSWPSCWPS
jgi:hypothetical protein